MNLVEIYDTRRDLTWSSQGDEHLAEFEEDGVRYGVVVTKFEEGGVRYGVVVTIEEGGGLRFGRVDFHVKEKDGSLRFNAREASPSVYSVLGIISNGVVERFGDLDGFYLVAKRSLYPDEYEQRVRLYGKIAHRLHLKLQLGLSFINRPNESISLLTKNDTALELLKQLLGDELKEQP